MKVQLTVNGKTEILETLAMARLLDVLRENMRLTGTKEGCGEGECGACTVLVNGEIVNSCLIPMAQLEGACVETIENVAQEKVLHAVQESFIKCGGAQCGICTPGMIMSAINLLKRNPQLDEQAVRQGLAGNLCRCTGYRGIFESVLDACKKREALSGGGKS